MMKTQTIQKTECLFCGNTIDLDSAKTGKKRDYCTSSHNMSHYVFVNIRMVAIIEKFECLKNTLSVFKHGMMNPVEVVDMLEEEDTDYLVEQQMFFINHCQKKIKEKFPSMILSEQLKKMKTLKLFDTHIIHYLMHPTEEVIRQYKISTT